MDPRSGWQCSRCEKVASLCSVWYVCLQQVSELGTNMQQVLLLYHILSLSDSVFFQPQLGEGIVRMVPGLWPWWAPPSHARLVQEEQTVSHWLWA